MFGSIGQDLLFGNEIRNPDSDRSLENFTVHFSIGC